MNNETNIFKKLFIFEMANNHMGDVDHGIQLIRKIKEACEGFDFQFGFKLQYRHLNTFIHPDFQKRMDIKYVKRFKETALSPKQFKRLKDEIDAHGFLSICTPFDETSVDLLEKHQFDVIKIGSCSFTDWSLLERVVKTDKPIIASTAGSTLEDIDRVTSFFEHRNKKFVLMHCVGQYPTEDNNFQLNQIDLLRSRYPHVTIGYSTHEHPDNMDAIGLAIAKGAEVFERHVGLETDSMSVNAYSSTPHQVSRWLKFAQKAYDYGGTQGQRYDFTDNEIKTLMSLRRGIFAGRDIKEGQKILLTDVFAAIPTQEDQLTMNDMSKYIEYYAQKDIGRLQPVLLSDTRVNDNVQRVAEIVEQVKKVIRDSKVLVPKALDLEISHHYGIDKFEEFGATIVNLLNREYCMKLIVLVPGQTHPEQYHKEKVETFRILHGDVLLELDGEKKVCKPGDFLTVEKGSHHIFSSETGAVIEEISTTYVRDDSFYVDDSIMKNPDRKTLITVWMDI